MDTIQINPLIVSVNPTAEAIIHPIDPTEHGGGVKKVLAVVATVAMPFVAAPIASAIGLSGAISAAAGTVLSAGAAATVGGAVGGAIVGAGLGAITASVTGQSIKAGALSGAIGGGLGGWMGAGSPAPAAQAGSAATTTPGVGGAAASGGSNTYLASYSGAGGSAAGAGGAGAAGSAGLGSSIVAGAKSLGSQFLKNMGDVPGIIASNITSPKNLANMTIQAGSMLLGAALVPDPALEGDPEYQRQLQAYKDELQQLKARDEAAFNRKMDLAQQYLVQAGHFDPTYFANLNANRAAITAGLRLNEAQRAAAVAGKPLTSGDLTRANLDLGLGIQKAYAQGSGSGLDYRGKALGAAAAAMPAGAPTSAINAQYNLANLQQSDLERRIKEADKQRENITNFFAGFNIATGSDKKDKKQIKEVRSQLDTSAVEDPKKDNSKKSSYKRSNAIDGGWRDATTMA